MDEAFNLLSDNVERRYDFILLRTENERSAVSKEVERRHLLGICRNFEHRGDANELAALVASFWSASQLVLCSSEASFETRIRLECVHNCWERPGQWTVAGSTDFECSGPQLGDLNSKFSGLSLKVSDQRCVTVCADDELSPKQAKPWKRKVVEGGGVERAGSCALSQLASLALSNVCSRLHSEVMITYIDPHITVEQLCQEMKDICRFTPDQVFTMKWVDEEVLYRSVACWVEAFRHRHVTTVNLLCSRHPGASGCYQTVPNRRQALDCARIICSYRYFCADSVSNFMTGFAGAQVVCKVSTTSVNEVTEVDLVRDVPYLSGMISSRRK
ncbi:hypothetical protein ANN_04999 [Periplaneta americana]|uniref:Uncharacterized protein n=1 Tax=Periplaneta americana TaxID=6978 RepID=A0ABQ8TB56_PERAM|nr:hypothetical protein ANN_04999 [Periplaneta americana]